MREKYFTSAAMRWTKKDAKRRAKKNDEKDGGEKVGDGRILWEFFRR
jgi:hypothetical protein